MKISSKILVLALLLMAFPMKQWAQTHKFNSVQATIEFNITEIDRFDERIFFIHNLLNDSRFDVVNSEEDGVFVISADDAFETLNLTDAFADFRAETTAQFSQMDKETASEVALEYKSELPSEVVASLMMDYYVRSRQNNHCADADPFCTDNGLYQFPAGVNAGNGEPGPNYACLSTTPNPAWYYMRIGNPGGINIYMYSTPEKDIDFCCWGPFEDPVTPCPNGLTLQKKVSCSYSANPTETCVIPTNAQTGQYYIMVITNFSNQQCNISFQKTGGAGTTDCGIMPPLVNNDGPYCVGETIHLTANGQAGATYSWTGPGGFASSQQNPTRPNCTMSMAGTYTCTISLNGQTNSATTEIVIYPQPTANFTATTVCKGNPTQFTSTSSTNPPGQTMSYQWNFGDGQTSTQQNPSHQYANAGNYSVSLTVGCGNNQCTHTKTQSVTVYEAPVANAGPDGYCDYGTTYQLHGNGGTGTFNFHWEPADKVTNPNAQNTQTVPLYADQTFTLTVSNPQGQCSDNDQVTVHINGSAMAVSAGPDISICQGGSGEIYVAAGGGTGNYTFSWTPTTGLSNPNIANPIASPTQTTTYTCHVSDGATSQNVSVTVTVNDVIIEHDYASICPDENYIWHGSSYNEIGTYQIDTVTEQGCDKTLFLHLDHYPTYDETTITEYICYGDSYYFYGTPYDYTCQVAYTDHTAHGCDSIVRLNLTVYPPNDTTIIDPTICSYQSFNFHGTEYNHDGDIAYFDTIDNHGCLKVEKLILTVGEYQMPPVQYEYVCYGHDETPSFYWDKTGSTYTQDTYDEIILPDPYGGCDFKYRLNLKFHQEFYSQEEPVVRCDEYIWPLTGERFTQTDHHAVRSFSGGGGPNFDCDSTYVLNITINHSHTNAETTFNNECDSVAFDWFGNTLYFKANGTYSFSDGGETTLGCDTAMRVIVENMRYTPKPCLIAPSDSGNSGAIPVNDSTYAVITNTEFFSFNYEFYISETGASRWESCEWSISKPTWSIEPSFNASTNSSFCTVYVADHDDDDVILTATAKSSCGEVTRHIYLKSTFFDIDENGKPSADVSIVPNPNNGQMRLSFENMEGRVHIKVFDMHGNQIDDFETQVSADRQNYDYNMKRNADGIYFFVISDSDRTLTRKAVIIH